MFELIKKKLFGKPNFGLDTKNLSDRFSQIYSKNIFGGKESLSGEGSNLEQTAEIRRELPKLVSELGVRSIMDAPCGDWNWLKASPFEVEQYIGVDIVKELIEKNQHLFGSNSTSFTCLNLAEDLLPRADLIFCRDCLVHLTYNDIHKVLANFKNSGSKYLLTTTFTNRDQNSDLIGDDIWRTLNLELPPFNFPKPLKLINEKCSEYHNQFSDKSLGLWLLEEID